MVFNTARRRRGMKPLTKIMYVSSILLTSGIAMWLYGALVDVDSMENAVETIAYGERLKVHAAIDPRVDPYGIYVVRVDRLVEGAINAHVLDPHGNKVVDFTLDTYSVDSRFSPGTAGTYTLVVINKGGPVGVTGAIGGSHDEFRILVSEIGFVMMLVGLGLTSTCSAILIKRLLF